MDAKTILEQFPLHYHAWHNNYEELDKLLTAKQDGLDVIDPRGRSPLHLSITLGHLESVKVLLRHGANADTENGNYWTAVQESIATGDPEMVQVCLQHRDSQRNVLRTQGVPGLLQRLTEAPDFYVEMKWEFTSWVPLVSRMCPSDTYKVWKSGSNVRIDTTLLGFDNMNWQRGSRSYVFKGQGSIATVMEIDHDARRVISENIRVVPTSADSMAIPSEDAIAARLTSPIVTTYVDTEKIAFERSKSGVWGWRSDKTEVVNNYNAKVFCASNVNLVTKTRTEHLTEQDKKLSKKVQPRSPLDSFLGAVEEEEQQLGAAAASNKELSLFSRNPCCITPEEYFDASYDLAGRDIGRPIEQKTKTQKFRAQMWLCEDFPLSLPEQVVPIIDLMATSNAHFRKLKDFITLQLPAGFPVKIEIPLFHVLNARITFGNILATVNDAEGVICLRDGDSLTCTVDPSVFDPPSTYSVLGDNHHGRQLRDEDDQLLQFAIQQSLMESGTETDQVTLWEALNKSNSTNFGSLRSAEEQIFQQTLAESMGLSGPIDTVRVPNSVDRSSLPPSYESIEDEQLRLILELSQQEQRERERREKERQKEEDDELERILELSLLEK